MINPHQPLTVRLSPQLKAQLNAWAETEGLTLSAHIRRLLMAAVKNKDKEETPNE